MARYLLDSDAVIDYLRGVAPSAALIRSLYERGDQLCLCGVVVAEVYAGLPPPHDEDAVAFLEGCEFLTTGLREARTAGEWRYSYARLGRTFSITDLLVAATALSYQASVVTGNVSDYPMQEVSVVPLPRTRMRQ